MVPRYPLGRELCGHQSRFKHLHHYEWTPSGYVSLKMCFKCWPQQCTVSVWRGEGRDVGWMGEQVRKSIFRVTETSNEFHLNHFMLLRNSWHVFLLNTHYKRNQFGKNLGKWNEFFKFCENNSNIKFRIIIIEMPP